jgi:hypothetical protein
MCEFTSDPHLDDRFTDVPCFGNVVSRARGAFGRESHVTESETGPIDYLVVEWEPGNQPTGEAFPYLIDLVERGIIRVLDLVFIRKEFDGSVVAIDISDLDLDGNPELSVFVGAASGLLGDEDAMEAGSILREGSSAAMLLFENAWAGPFAAALRRGGAQMVASGRIPTQEVVAALDELEAVDAS